MPLKPTNPVSPVIDPLFWLGLSILLVAVSLTAVLVAALPALQELARAARSAEKLFDTLSRELPPTLQSIRLTGMEISDLTDELNQGVQSAGKVTKQLDRGLEGARQQVQEVGVTTQSVWTGVRTAWRTFSRPLDRRRRSGRRYPTRSWSEEQPSLSSGESYYQSERLPAAAQPELDLPGYELETDRGSMSETSDPDSNPTQQ